jgi:hypothetical protein
MVFSRNTARLAWKFRVARSAIVFVFLILLIPQSNLMAAPTASVADITVSPGSNVTFTVILSEDSATDVDVSYATQDGSATAGSDYTNTSGTVTIPAGPGLVSLDQWADAVLDFSSEWNSDGPVDYRAIQVLGASDTNSYGDIKTSWAPKKQNGNTEYVTVSYVTPVYATGVTIRETWGNGFVTQN